MCENGCVGRSACGWHCARHAGTGFTKWSLLIHSVPASDAYHSNILLLSFSFFFLVEMLSSSAFSLSFHSLMFGGADYQTCQLEGTVAVPSEKSFYVAHLHVYNVWHVHRSMLYTYCPFCCIHFSDL